MPESKPQKQASLPTPIGEESFRLLAEGVQDYAIVLLDPTAIIQSWNSGAERIKGYTANEILGKHFTVFYTQEDLQAGRADYEIREATLTGRFEDEGWRVRKDGTRFWANVVLSALYDKNHVLKGFAKVTRDITERK